MDQILFAAIRIGPFWAAVITVVGLVVIVLGKIGSEPEAACHLCGSEGADQVLPVQEGGVWGLSTG